jgi:phage baseplate assembly protein W
MTQFGYPFRIDARGRTAGATSEQHIRDMIAQVLFTTPGERVNRPDFGCDLRQLVFAPSTSEQAPAIQYLVQGALQQWLGEWIQVEAVQVDSEENVLSVTVQYVVPQTEERRVVQFQEGGLP